MDGRSLEDLRSERDRFAVLFEHAPTGLALLDAAGTMREVNPAWCAILGESRSAARGGRFASRIHPDDRARARDAFRRVTRGHAAVERWELRVMRPDGAVHWVLVGLSRSPEPDMYVAHLADITNRKVLEERLAHQALHDPLTSLPNRVLFLDRLGYALALLNRTPGMLAVLFLDLDGFKAVNDSLGHVLGDTVLVEVAARLRRAVRTSDPLARFGGDEFALLVRELETLEPAIELAERMADAVAPPVRVGGTEVRVSVSIGIATTRGGEETSDVLRRADVAMYRAKSRPDRRWAIARKEG